MLFGLLRVGKTYLIHQFFNGRFDFKLTGIYNKPKNVQLENFSYELNRQSGKNDAVPKDWLQAFQMLRDYLSSLIGRQVVLDDLFQPDEDKLRYYQKSP